jgi:glycosyltransferase involved in cell wall biosynthesis
VAGRVKMGYIGSTPEISLLVPAYNEEGNISVLVEKISELQGGMEEKIELVIVNDGSTDGTAEEIGRCMKKFGFVITSDHKRNLGMTAALVTAYNKSSGKYLIVFPADLQYLPECIPEIVKPLKEGYDLVAGWKDGKYEKRMVSFVYNAVSQMMFHNLQVHDLNSIKGMKREVFGSLQLRKDWHRYLVVFAAEMGYKIKEVRVKVYPRLHGKSKFSGKGRILVGFFDLLSVKYLLSFSSKPLLLFGVTGLGLIFLGILVGLCEIAARVFFHSGFRPVLYLVMLLIMVGVNLFALGFIAELVVSIRERTEMVERKLSKLGDEFSLE